MDKAKLKRHNLAYVTEAGRRAIYQEAAPHYSGAFLAMVREVLLSPTDIPGIMRRAPERPQAVPLGFVHYGRVEEQRLRLPAYAQEAAIEAVVTPYELLQGRVYGQEDWTPRNHCLEAAANVFELAVDLGLQVGILGSAALELATGLPYTDDASDLDILVQSAPLEGLQELYSKARHSSLGVSLDFEVDLPNGYGVKLVELFMDTSTVLGKSMEDVQLLSKADTLEYLK